MNRLVNTIVARKRDIALLAVVFVFLAVMGILIYQKYRPSDQVNYSMILDSSTALESHMFVAGDVYWGRRMYDWSQQSSLKEKYPFSQLHQFNRPSYDAWIANLECPSVPGVVQPIGYDPGLVEFNCDSRYLKELAKWFTIVSLANNHTSNQEREVGLSATRQALDNVGIQHFGSFTPHQTSDLCRVVELPARARMSGKQVSTSVPIAMCGYAGVYFTVNDKAISEISRYSKHMPVIVMPHMGKEYESTIDSKRQSLYRKMIDAGADAVIGNHPHWVQPTEVYKGKLIAYSMGNFIFDQDFSPEVSRSAAFDITMSVATDSVSADQLRQWTELGAICHMTTDSCLSVIERVGLVELPIRLSYDIVGVDTSGKVTHRANQRLKEGITDRLDWAETRRKLAEI